MQPPNDLDMYLADWFAAGGRLGQLRTPTVTAVAGCALGGGVRFGRRLFHAVFATADHKEGMGASVDKRRPEFRHR